MTSGDGLPTKNEIADALIGLQRVDSRIGSALTDVDMLFKEFHRIRNRKAVEKMKTARAELDKAIALLEPYT